MSRGLQPCRVCALEPECLLWPLGSADAQRVERIVLHPEPLAEGASLFNAGDGLQAVYAVRAGAFKTFRPDGAGREEVLSFGLPGELLGLDGLHAQIHDATAIALQDSVVCVLPYPELTKLMGEIERLRQQILRLASRDLEAGRRGDLAPEQRLARFLLGLFERNHGNGIRGADLELPMSRQDIGSYLRLAPEQVTQIFSDFVAAELIHLERRRLRLLDPSRLGGIAQNGLPPTGP